jgi:hypothetical protein
MTCAELAKLISHRLMAQAMQSPDPLNFVATAWVRLQNITTESELIQFGFEYDILGPTGLVN